MKLYLVRHGESEANINYDILKTKRDEDVELTYKGHHDGINAGLRLRELLGEKALDATVLVSPWRRARQTFNCLNAAFGGEMYGVQYQLITEHFMNLANNPKNWDAFERYKKANWAVEEFMDVMYDGGESLRGVRNRAQLFIRSLKEDSHGDVVVAVSHGQFIKQVISLIKGIKSDDVPHPANGEVIEIEL